jgi:hypothetical protein
MAVGRYAKLLLAYLVDNPQTNPSGFFYVPDLLICHHTGIDQTELPALWSELAGILKHDPRCQIVWIPALGEWRGDSRSAAAASKPQLKALKGSALASEVAEHFAGSSGRNRVRIDESKAAEWGMPEALVALWNQERAPELRSLASLSPAQRLKCVEYLRAFPEKEFWTKSFAATRESDFLSGKSLPYAGRDKPFKADFMWFLQKGQKDQVENCWKAFNGKYANEQSNGRNLKPSTEHNLALVRDRQERLKI